MWSVDVAIGVARRTTQPVLKPFLSRLEELIARVIRRYGAFSTRRDPRGGSLIRDIIAARFSTRELCVFAGCLMPIPRALREATPENAGSVCSLSSIRSLGALPFGSERRWIVPSWLAMASSQLAARNPSTVAAPPDCVATEVCASRAEAQCSLTEILGAQAPRFSHGVSAC
jgi:hypothetical protein